MANRGYPDDDGSRDPQGRHDEGWQRDSICDVRAKTVAQNVDEMQVGDRVNGFTTLDGVECETPYYGPVDGDANTTPGRALAAYPAFVSAT